MEQLVGGGLGLVIGLAIAILVGAIIGWMASLIVRRQGSGFWGDVLIGIAGSLLANLLLPAVGVSLAGPVSGILAALAGAVLLLLVLRLLWR